MKNWKVVFAIGCGLIVAACGNPGEISDAEYAKYKELGAPKILYSCNRGETLGFDMNAVFECQKLLETAPEKASACMDKAKRQKKPIIDVGYTAGIGTSATYNKILDDAKHGCSGDFKVLESKQ